MSPLPETPKTGSTPTVVVPPEPIPEPIPEPEPEPEPTPEPEPEPPPVPETEPEPEPAPAEPEGIPDQEASVPNYYQFIPRDLPSGVYDTPQLGEVITGRVIDVPSDFLYIVQGSADWTKSSKKAFEDQPTLDEHRASLQIPVETEE